MALSSIGSNLPRAARARRTIAIAAAAALLGAAAGAGAQDEPAATPVRWDSQRVTKMSKELADAVQAAREAVRQSPMAHNIAQRTTYYELLETMRLVANTSKHLHNELESGKDADETRPIFERISSLRFDAEEIGRRALVEAPVIDALVKAGAIHNQMKPYYYGKN